MPRKGGGVFRDEHGHIPLAKFLDTKSNNQEEMEDIQDQAMPCTGQNWGRVRGRVKQKGEARGLDSRGAWSCWIKQPQNIICSGRN